MSGWGKKQIRSCNSFNVFLCCRYCWVPGCTCTLYRHHVKMCMLFFHRFRIAFAVLCSLPLFRILQFSKCKIVCLEIMGFTRAPLCFQTICVFDSFIFVVLCFYCVTVMHKVQLQLYGQLYDDDDDDDAANYVFLFACLLALTCRLNSVRV